jgi:hypothetical protein
MHRSPVFALFTLLSAFPVLLPAKDLTPNEQAFFDQHTSDMIKIRFEPQRLDAPALLKVFSAPFYAVKMALQFADMEETSHLVMVRIGDNLVSLSRPSGDSDVPEIQKMLNPDFKLRTDADATALQEALDTAYPIVSDDDKPTKAFRHSGQTWIFVRGNFIDRKLGFIFETDAKGAIKSVKYVVELP